MSVTQAAERPWTVVRAGSVWWVLSAVACVLAVFFCAAAFDRPADPATRLGPPPLMATIAAACLVVATERWSISGRTLLGVTMFSVWIVDAADVTGVDDDNGLQVVLRSGRRLEPAICQPSLAQAIIRNRRRRLEATRLRTWLDSVRSPASLSWGQVEIGVRVRWHAVVGVGAAAVLAEGAALLSWALA